MVCLGEPRRGACIEATLHRVSGAPEFFYFSTHGMTWNTNANLPKAPGLTPLYRQSDIFPKFGIAGLDGTLKIQSYLS